MKAKTTTIKPTETQLRDLKHTLQQTIWMANDTNKSPEFIATVKELLEAVQKQ
jgi:hypothetical protein